jgi:hypothetical protein
MDVQKISQSTIGTSDYQSLRGWQWPVIWFVFLLSYAKTGVWINFQGVYSWDIQLTTTDSQQIFRKIFQTTYAKLGAVNFYMNRFSFCGCLPGYQTASGGGVPGKTKTSPLEGRKSERDPTLFSMLFDGCCSNQGPDRTEPNFSVISPDVSSSIQQWLWLVSLTIVLSLSLVETGSSHRLLDLSLMLSKDLIHVHSRRHQWPGIVDSVLFCAIRLQN